MKSRIALSFLAVSALGACGNPVDRPSPLGSEARLTNTANSESQTNAAVDRYVARTTRLQCDGLEVFDFLLESASVIGEWCRKQNLELGSKGCGVGTSLCVKELMVNELPGGSLSIGLSATAGFTNGSSSGSSLTQSDYSWSRGHSSNASHGSWSSDGSHNYLEFTFSVGVNIPLGNRNLQRVTCINPLDHEYVRMLADNVILRNETLKKFAVMCQVRP